MVDTENIFREWIEAIFPSIGVGVNKSSTAQKYLFDQMFSFYISSILPIVFLMKSFMGFYEVQKKHFSSFALLLSIFILAIILGMVTLYSQIYGNQMVLEAKYYHLHRFDKQELFMFLSSWVLFMPVLFVLTVSSFTALFCIKIKH